MGRSTSSNLGVVKDESAETSTTKAPRRTPREIAQANLDEAKAKLEKVENRKARLTSDLERADAQIAELTEEVEWLAGRPALRKTDDGTVSEAVEDGALATQDA